MLASRQFCLSALSLALLWTLLSLVLYTSTSPRQMVDFVRLYAFLCCYLCALWPLWFQSHLHWGKSFVAVVSFAAVMIFGCASFAYSISRGLPQQYIPYWFQIALVQWALLFFYSAVALLLQRLGISRLWSAFAVSVLATAMMANLLLCEHLLEYWPDNHEWILNGSFYSNPLVMVAGCLPGYDYLRAGIFYLPIGSRYPFSYPQWHYASAGYGVTAVICTLLAWKKADEVS